MILINAGDWESARPLNTEAVELARIVAAPDQVAILLSNQANFALQLDRDPATAAALAEEGLDWARQAQSEDVVMTMLLGLTEMRMEAGDLDGAEATHAEAIELDAALGDWHGEIGYTQLHSARLALARGDIDQAAADLAQNAVFLRRVFEQDDTQLSIAAQPLHLWAEVAISLGQRRKAVTLLGAQVAWYETTHRRQDPAEQAAAQDTLSGARVGLDPEIFHEAWEDGRAMSGPEALDYALDQLGSGAQPIPGSAQPAICAPSSTVAGSAYVLPPQGVNATPSARVVVSRREVWRVEKVHGGGDRRGVGAKGGG